MSLFHSLKPFKLPPSGIPANAPPINTVPAEQTTPQGTAKQFSEAGGNQIKVGDVDTPIITATINSSVGTIEVIPNPSTFVSGNNTARVIATGSVANVNRVLNGMYFRPPTADVTAVITLRTSDGANVDIDSFNVIVGIGTPPPPAPVAPVNTVPSSRTTAYQTVLSFAGLNLTVYDADTPSLTTTITATSGKVAASGAGGATISGSGTSVITISGLQAQINSALNTLTYTPNTGFSGIGKIDIQTSDGVLIDYDTVNIVVSPPVGAPVNTVPGARTMGPNGTMTFSTANGYPISVTDPNSATVQVNLSCLSGKLKAVATGTLPLADGFQPKIVYGFWLYWSAQRITDVSTNFNIIGLFHFRNSGNGLDNGSASWPSPGNPTAAEIDIVTARGQKVFVVVGGFGYAFHYQTRQQSDNLLAGLIPFINSLGGGSKISGVDFNNWNTDITGLDYATELIYMAQQLKATFGANFAIVFPPKNNAAYNRNLMKAMSDAGCLTWANPLFTDNVNYKTAGVVKSEIDTWVATPLNATKVMMGLSSNYSLSNSLTLAECTREWDAAAAAHPNLRGVGCYSTDTDAAVSYAFANAFKARFDTAMATGASISSNNSIAIAISGTLAQVNDALNGLTYEPDIGYTGGDTITVTTTDGTLSDTDTIAITIAPG